MTSPPSGRSPGRRGPRETASTSRLRIFGRFRVATCRRGPRGQRGLASHEWLLLIAAAAGFTALAIFVLAETVDDAVDRAGADDPARLASARREARLVENEAVTIHSVGEGEDWQLRHWGEWQDHFTTKCENIGNAYRAHGFKVTAAFEPPVKPGTTEEERRKIPMFTGKEIENDAAEALAAADPDDPQARKPQVKCRVE